MGKINYVIGDATNPQGDGNKLILHICNDIGAWGAGFVLALSAKWSKPEAKYLELPTYILGQTQLVQVEEDVFVVNMIAQHGVGPDKDGIPPIRYLALLQCLQQVEIIAQALSATVHCPRMGAGLAGGDWNLIETIVRESLSVPVTVYDLP